MNALFTDRENVGEGHLTLPICFVEYWWGLGRVKTLPYGWGIGGRAMLAPTDGGAPVRIN